MEVLTIVKVLRKSRFGGLAYTEHVTYKPDDHLFKTIVDSIESSIKVSNQSGLKTNRNNMNLITYTFETLSLNCIDDQFERLIALMKY